MRKDRPNILVIMSDQHSRHVLGCYGNGLVRTPNLDRLASDGMLFTDAYCPSPLCVPSRMSFMTSRTPTGNRVWDNSHMLHGGIPTWAHALGAAGYETALIGRMHFVGPEQRHGFEKRPLGEFSARHPGTPMAGGPAWTKYSSVATSQCRESVEIAGTGTTAYQWFDERVAEAACDYLRRKAGGRDGRPFAAVAGFLLPHNPFIAPRGLFEYYREKIDVPPVEDPQPATVRRLRERRGLMDPLPEERIRIARAAYFALCELFDSHVGKLLDCLDRTGLAADTLVVYTSDHGEMAGEHGVWAKGCYYEGSAGVPLIARLLGEIAAGTVSDVVCNLLDLGLTFTELARTEPMHATDGRSLLPVLRGRRAEDRPDETFSELVGIRAWPRGAVPDNYPVVPSRMVRSGRWKLWVSEDDEGLPPALFDLEDDPGEERDLGADPRFAEVRDGLLRKVHEGWDPMAAREGSIDATKAREALTAWGRAVRPDSPDALPFPPPEIEADIELL